MGTHDNAPIKEWITEITDDELEFCKEYMGYNGKTDSDFVWSLIRLMMASVADTAIILMQDCLELGKESRMNTPSMPYGNWQWRMQKDAITDALTEKIATLTELYGR